MKPGGTMGKIGFLMALALGWMGCAKEAVAPSVPVMDPSGIVIPEVFQAPPGAPSSVRAGLYEVPDTRSRLSSGDGAAKVLWTTGDSFVTLYEKDGGYSMAAFRTYDDGVPSAAFWSYYTIVGHTFHCIYPDFNQFGIYEGDMLFGLTIPPVQKAVAGGIEEGLNLAYAYADKLIGEPEDQLMFYNIPSLLKFRLKGAVVSRVRKVAFTVDGTVAGDLIIHNVDGLPVEYENLSFSGDEHFSTVFLQGEFKAGVDYYIVLWPRQVSGFRMEFSDGAGHFTCKQSDKTVTFERSRIKDFGTIDLGKDFVDD